MEEPESRLCIVCGRNSSDGLQFLGIRLCPACLAMIQRLQPGDPEYENVKNRMGQLWVSAGILDRSPRP